MLLNGNLQNQLTILLFKNSKVKIQNRNELHLNHVYPLFGAIDIRNSSVERSQSIQLDFIEQLQMAADCFKKSTDKYAFSIAAGSSIQD